MCSEAGNLNITTANLWNGPICSTCGTGYLGEHECDPRVLRAKADQLNDLANKIVIRQAEREHNSRDDITKENES